MPTASPLNRNARPTMGQAYAIIRQLTPTQQAKLLARLNKNLRDEVDKAAQQVQNQMEADAVFVTEEEINAEVEAVRAERYAAGRR